MFRLGLMFIVALLLIDAGLMGNIGAILGSVIDPSNMVETGATSTTSQGPGLTPTPPGTQPKIPKSPTQTPGYYPPGTTIPYNV